MSTSAIRCLTVLKALRGHTFSGISNTELAQKTGESKTNITRALQDLVSTGFAEKRDDGKYSLSISMLQIANAHAAETQRMQQRLDEVTRNTTIY